MVPRGHPSTATLGRGESSMCVVLEYPQRRLRVADVLQVGDRVVVEGPANSPTP